MDSVLQEIVKWLPAIFTGLVPAVIAYISLSNRQRANKLEAQEIVFEEFRKARNENGRILKLLEDEQALRRESQADYETERERLNTLITENSDKLNKLETALSQNKLLMQQVSKERDDAKTELDNTRRELTETRTDLEKRLTDIQAILDNLKGDYDQMTKTYDEAKIERTRVEKAFQERVDKLEKQLEVTEGNLADVQGRLTDVQGQLDALKIELEQTRAERDDLKQKNIQLELRVTELETERNILQQQVNILRSELDELRTRAPEGADNRTEPPPTGAVLPIDGD